MCPSCALYIVSIGPQYYHTVESLLINNNHYLLLSVLLRRKNKRSVKKLINVCRMFLSNQVNTPRVATEIADDLE